MMGRSSGFGTRAAAVISLIAVGAVASGCSTPSPVPSPTPGATAESRRPTPSSSPPASALPTPERGIFRPAGAPEPVSTHLDVPWSVAVLPGGALLVSERGTGVVKEIRTDGSSVQVGTVPGVRAAGEGGLLGIAVRDVSGTRYLYAYLTSATDNRIVRMPLGGEPGSFSLGPAQDILTGIPKASNHNGGRIAFGPDGMLYATTGDASQPQAAQDPTSLGGKILRMTPEGAAAPDNPIPGSRTYSYGHRNPQGIAWDADGTLWASEFGQNTWDELNRIRPGGNYGWPVVEGAGHDDRFVYPVHQWSTDEASPSGLAIRGDTAFMAGLGGQRLWTIDLTAPQQADDYLVRQIGRIRDAVIAADGSLLLLSSNTDGRGRPSARDDVLYRLPLSSG